MPDDNVSLRESKRRELEQRLQESQQQMAQKNTVTEFQADTLSRYSSVNAYFDPKSGRTVRNVYSHQDSESKIKADISHEAKHAANAELGIPDVSAEQFYQLAVLDEVSAWTVSALCWREEYLAAEDKKKFLEEADKSPFWSSASVPYEYLDAIKQGKIDPESKDPKEFDKEMKLLVGEQFANMAAKNSGYVKNFETGTRLFMNTSERSFQPNDAEFERFAKHYMTIGGIDFRKYMANDWPDRIYVPERIKNAGTSLAENGIADNAQMLAVDGLVYDGKVSLEQYHNLLQHKKIAENVFYNINDDMKKELKSGNSSVDRRISESHDLFKQLSTYRGLSSGNEMENYLNVNMALAFNSGDGAAGENQEEYLKKLKQIYTLPGTDIDLTSHIDGFDPNGVPVKTCPAIEEFRRNPEQYRQDHPYKPLLANALEYNQGDVQWQEHSEEHRVSEVLKMDVLDAGSNFLKAERESRAINQELEELKKQEEREKVEPLTTKPQTLMYKMSDGIKFYFNRSQQYHKAELKSFTNERGEKVEMTVIDGKKHGAEIIRDENGHVKGLKIYDNGKELDLSKHKVNLDEQQKIVDGEPARMTQVMLDGKPFGAVIVETSRGTKADFYDNKGQRMEGAAGAIIKRTEDFVRSDTMANSKTPKREESVLREHSDTPMAETENSVEASGGDKTNEEKLPAENQNADANKEENVSMAPKDPQTIPADSCEQKMSESMQRGHNRIAEMRAKVAKGHDEERMSMYQHFIDQGGNAEIIRQLRSSRPVSSGIIRPAAIRADVLAKKLAALQQNE